MVIEHELKGTYKEKVSVNYTRFLGEKWCELLKDTLTSDYMDNLAHYMNYLYTNKKAIVYPKESGDVFKAYQLTNPRNLKVVIFGNEPYDCIYSNGLAFGNYGALNTSIYSQELRTIEKCVMDTFHESSNSVEFDRTLESWAEQGVLLLNTSLIAESNKKMEHALAFRNLIRETVRAINDENLQVVFVFTNKGQSNFFKKYIDTAYHNILEIDGFTIDSDIFNQINDLLVESDGEGAQIEW